MKAPSQEGQTSPASPPSQANHSEGSKPEHPYIITITTTITITVIEQSRHGPLMLLCFFQVADLSAKRHCKFEFWKPCPGQSGPHFGPRDKRSVEAC